MQGSQLHFLCCRNTDAQRTTQLRHRGLTAAQYLTGGKDWPTQAGPMRRSSRIPSRLTNCRHIALLAALLAPLSEVHCFLATAGKNTYRSAVHAQQREHKRIGLQKHAMLSQPSQLKAGVKRRRSSNSSSSSTALCMSSDERRPTEGEESIMEQASRLGHTLAAALRERSSNVYNKAATRLDQLLGKEEVGSRER